jgi:hypothetical protein
LAAFSNRPRQTFGLDGMTPPITLVYDLDGTLADTAGDLIGALNVVLTVSPSSADRTRSGSASRIRSR